MRLDVSCESSARQGIHLKHQALFSSKDKTKKIKVLSAGILLGTIRVKACDYNRQDPLQPLYQQPSVAWPNLVSFIVYIKLNVLIFFLHTI